MSRLADPDAVWEHERMDRLIAADDALAAASYYRTLRERLNLGPIPLVTEQVIAIGQSEEARLAREHLASLSPERRAELDWEWSDRLDREQSNG